MQLADPLCGGRNNATGCSRVQQLAPSPAFAP